MITPTSEKQLQILLSNSNRALAEAVRQATPEQLELMKAGKGVGELLASLTGEALKNAKSDTLLLEILRNNPVFRQLGSFSGNLQALLQNLRTDEAFSQIRTQLEAFLRASLTSPDTLKQQVADSGIFLESKLLASADGDTPTPFSRDVKALLLQLHQELTQASTPGTAEIMKQIDRLLLQIDYHQLYSHLSNAAVLYFPFTWDLLEEGTLAFRKTKERNFYCRIELRFKAFGMLHLLVALSGEKKVVIRARAEQEALERRIREQLPLLRAALRRANLDVQHIEIARFAPEAKHARAYRGESGDIDPGFEVKI
jgi:hypothetical protein